MIRGNEMKSLFILTLLIAGLVIFPAMGYAVSPDPDVASGIDAHSNTVAEGLVVGVSDITSGNTIQVGPVGGIYKGADSVEQAGETTDGSITQIYTGASVLTGVNFVADAAGDFIEIYDGTSRGDYTNCILDVQNGVANDSQPVEWPVEMTTGIAAYVSGGVAQVRYRIEDQSE